MINTKKKLILSSMLWFTVIISISTNFSPKLLYAEQIDTTDSLIMENSNNLQTKKSDNNHNDGGKFNIAVAADWGCTEDTEKTAENIQGKDPEIVIAAGDLSYEESADCWFEIIQPFMSKMK